MLNKANLFFENLIKRNKSIINTAVVGYILGTLRANSAERHRMADLIQGEGLLKQ